MPSAKTAPTLKALKAQLKDIQSSIFDISRFVDQFKEETSTTQITLRLDRVDRLWEKYCETLVLVRGHAQFEEEDEVYDKDRQAISDRYFEVKSFLLDKVKERQPVREQDQSIRDSSIHGGLDHVRLPQIKLQTFNGEVDDWLSFRDLFTSLIHTKVELPAIEKFHYLKGCLQGEPKNLIDPFPLTEANYQVAWDTLLKRYDNSKLLKKRQIQSLFKLPTLQKESTVELHNLLEGFERIVQTLDQIVQTRDYKDLLLVNFLTTRLDPVTRRSWEEQSSIKDQDSVKDLTEFLHRRIRVLESMPSKPVDTRSAHQPQVPSKPKANVKTSYSSVQTSVGRCVVCKDSHFLYQCSGFQRLSVMERDSVLKTNGLCRNCFKTGHQAKDCQSRYSCRKCKGRHHTLVCFRSDNDTKVPPHTKANNASNPNETQGTSGSGSSQAANAAAANVVVSNVAHQVASQVLLATAVVLLEDNEGNRFPARALLDSGSESNFITHSLSQRMRVQRSTVEVSVLGIGQSAARVKQRILATVLSRISGFSRQMDFLVLPKVTVDLPKMSFNTKGWSIPEGIVLADPTFFQSNKVDIVLGIECFFDFFQTGRRVSLGERLPTLSETVFGWVVGGGVSSGQHPLRVNYNASTSENLEALVERFWKCEELESTKAYSKEETKCEEIFQNTVQRTAEGRYVVALPKNEDVFPRIGESRDIAFRRLQATERRLARDPSLCEQYSSFMEEYLLLGHMQKVSDQDSTKRCYLPHHAIVKEASTTTKLRVVFDASCKTSTGVSLNDSLLTGPIVQEELRSIILRCLMKQIMIVADVEKMFRQILLRCVDRPLTSILWRPSPTEEANVYELCTVTYGTKSAPFLATRTLNQLAMDEEHRFPLAAKAIREDTYVDDVLTGSDTIEAALELQQELEQLTNRGGFRLRKWASNKAEVLEGITADNLAIHDTEGISLDPDPFVKTLGLTWMPKSDTLRFEFKIPAIEPITELSKRRILSVIAMLFDPLGFVGAVITTAKVQMQQLWTLMDENGQRLDWDQPVPSTVGEAFKKFYDQLPLLNDIRIRRCVILPDAVSVQLHCFTDASEKAFGSCIYVRSQDLNGTVLVQLLSSKSRVAPLKTQTIPRLELCGALLGAELLEKVKRSIKIDAETHFWTDSTCVLRWIQSPPTTWVTFVANRVAKIQSVTHELQWKHVPGIQNPADLISRGISPAEIVQNQFWWHGPEWLKQDPTNWPNSSEAAVLDIEEPEKRRTIVAAGATEHADFNEFYLSKFSSYSNLVRRTAYWLRLMSLLRMPKKDRTNNNYLSTEELRNSECLLIRRVQHETFADELKALTQGDPVSRKSPLRWFSPFIGTDGVMRVGGRLGKSDESEEAKHPAVLPAKHSFTRMLLRYYHEKLLHAGPQLLLSVVRLRFWPLGGRNVVRQIIHKCKTCYRAKPTAVQQFMGDLPASRITVARPFSKAGVDYFGPIYVRPAPRRPAVKAYVAIFICLCTKAIHMELVTDLSTDRFIQALRRFVARRGRCVTIYSDNGTNFVGARNQLLELSKLLSSKDHKDAVEKYCSDEGMQWRFNPPSAPHFGGIWEAAVRSAKHHLLKVLGETPESPEDLVTLLTQIEACLNSRPLTAMSDDPNDVEPLTPAHFLIGSSLQVMPDQNLEHIPCNRLNKMQQMQQKMQLFWKRWRREYLHLLQARTKRWKPPIKVEIGQLVVIQDDNQPPSRWKMGRICEVHPGTDGVIRVVTLKTASGMLKRPVEKLCFLPYMDSEECTESTD